MQVSPVSFKGSYNSEFNVCDLRDDADVKKIENAIEIIREKKDSFENSETESTKKN